MKMGTEVEFDYDGLHAEGKIVREDRSGQIIFYRVEVSRVYNSLHLSSYTAHWWVPETYCNPRTPPTPLEASIRSYCDKELHR